MIRAERVDPMTGLRDETFQETRKWLKGARAVRGFGRRWCGGSAEIHTSKLEILTKNTLGTRTSLEILARHDLSPCKLPHPSLFPVLW